METQRVINFPTEAEVERACEGLNIVYCETSFKILYFLYQNGEACVEEISEAIFIYRLLVRDFAIYLRDRRILKSRRDGHRVYYSCVNPEAIKTILETALKL